MINISHLAKWFEQTLNNYKGSENVVNARNLIFKIFTDTGEYQKATREYNDITRVINGLYTVTDSDIQTTNTDKSGISLVGGLTIATMTSKIEFVIPCFDNEEAVYTVVIDSETGKAEKDLIQESNSTYLQSIRNLLSNVCAKSWFDTVVEFDITTTYSLAISGERVQLPELGDCFSFVIYAYYNIVENGSNSTQWGMFVDGVRVPFLSQTTRRIPTTDSNVYNHGLATKSIPTATTLGVSIELPMLKNHYFSGVLRKYLFTGDSDVHLIEMRDGNDNYAYLGYVGEVDTTASGTLNAGTVVTLCEAVPLYGTFSMPEKYNVYSVNLLGTDSTAKEIHIPRTQAQIGADVPKFWGASFPINTTNTNKVSYMQVKLVDYKETNTVTAYQNGILITWVNIPSEGMTDGKTYRLELLRSGNNGNL